MNIRGMLNQKIAKLEAMNPYKVLIRGYSMAYNKETEKIKPPESITEAANAAIHNEPRRSIKVIIRDFRRKVQLFRRVTRKAATIAPKNRELTYKRSLDRPKYSKFIKFRILLLNITKKTFCRKSSAGHFLN